MDAIETLRDKRGDEKVSFGDVADHLRDYLERRPEHREAVERIALFLARVEDLDHDHDDRPTAGLEGDRPVRT